MKQLIKNATIISPGSSHHGKKRDILIERGVITSIASSIAETKVSVITGNKLYISPGWIDTRARFCDPGEEQKENLSTGSKAAALGGFTQVLVMPSSQPPVDTKSSVEYVLRNSGQYGVTLLPAGCLSARREGKQLAELYDMYSSGAIAFTDDRADVNTELMVRALDYTRNFGGLVISFPLDKGVNPSAFVHEGPTSVSMGFKGLSGLSEELRLIRDIELLRYCGGRLHVGVISTSRSVELIRKARKEGLSITCSVAAHQLMYSDEDLTGYDTNLKVLPPLRGKKEQKALIAALRDGTIDSICSDHTPEDPEHKVVEFEDARFGMSSIQSAFCMARTAIGDQLSAEELISLFTTGPAALLGIDLPSLEEGLKANVTVFSLDEETTFTDSTWASKSKNNPIIGQTLKGRVYATIS